MSKVLELNSIAQAHQILGLPKPKHPLVTVVNDREFTGMGYFQGEKVIVNLYQVIFKQGGCGTILYGKNAYDYQEGTLILTAPGQVMAYQDSDTNTDSIEEAGWRLAFHPDLIRKSELGEKINGYSFFDYDVHEALHLSEDERKTIEGLVDIIIKEYSLNLDRHSQHLIITNIQLLLDYCRRFYDRQFYTRTNINSDVVSRFERLIRDYYQTEKAIDLGIPSVSYCADKLNLSSKYLSDLLKKETGKTAQEHIHLHIIERAKNSLLHSSQSVSEIGFMLGFEYPQHFSNLFKAKTGYSPREYRNMN